MSEVDTFMMAILYANITFIGSIVIFTLLHKYRKHGFPAFYVHEYKSRGRCSKCKWLGYLDAANHKDPVCRHEQSRSISPASKTVVVPSLNESLNTPDWCPLLEEN